MTKLQKNSDGRVAQFFPLNFWKMHGCGNDFVVFHIESDITDDQLSSLAQYLCDRNFGIGADGIIVSVPSAVADFGMRIFNSDGSDGEMCINGIRCFAKYQFDQNRVSEASQDSGEISVETTVSVVKVTVKRDELGLVTSASITLPAPSFNPLDCGVTTANDSDNISLRIDEYAIDVQLISMGNPHAVHWLAEDHETTDYELIRIGPRVETDATFHEKTNFEIAELVEPNYIRARVWERGVGETLACGSGACAVMASAHSRGLINDHAVVAMPGGELSIEWSGHGPITLEGLVTKVFEATIES